MGYKVRVTDLSTGAIAESLIPFSISVAPTTMTVDLPERRGNLGSRDAS